MGSSIHMHRCFDVVHSLHNLLQASSYTHIFRTILKLSTTFHIMPKFKFLHGFAAKLVEAYRVDFCCSVCSLFAQLSTGIYTHTFSKISKCLYYTEAHRGHSLRKPRRAIPILPRFNSARTTVLPFFYASFMHFYYLSILQSFLITFLSHFHTTILPS